MLFLLAFAGQLSAQKTIFVKHDAAGANDGTSWANAFTSLHTALQAAAGGDQVWVAAGTYKPSNAVVNASFSLKGGVQLYGGFNGTESTLGARNAETNVTILSGDHAGDDIAGDFTQKRVDNATHVVEIVAGASVTDRAVVDGFRISGGNTKIGAANPDASRRGGGILAVVPATVRNCRFTDNYGESGSGLAALGPDGSGVVVDNCLFESSEATASSAGIFLRDLVNGGEVNKCIFRNNKTNRGCLYILTSSGITADSCLFENNDAGANFAGAMFTWQSNFTLTNSIFRGNKAANSAAMYNDGRDGSHFFTIENCLFENNVGAPSIGAIRNNQASFLMKNCIIRGNKCQGFGAMYSDCVQGNDFFTIEDCLFEDNVVDDQNPDASSFGGAFYNWQASFAIKNTIFRNNQADVAGAMYNDGRSFQHEFDIENCTFENNKGNGYGGGAMYNWKSTYTITNSTFKGNFGGSVGGAIYNGDTTFYDIKACLFETNNASFGGAITNFGDGNKGTISETDFLNNEAATSGGAMVCGFTADATVTDCLFESNLARFGGAINNQNDYTKLTLEGSTFTTNSAEFNGGAVNVGTGMVLTVTDCSFEVNTADFGGAIFMAVDSLPLTKLLATNSVFLQNFATTQGAALNLLDTETELTNCLFIANINLGDGAGGAISNNARNDYTSSVKALNCTFADNSAPIGGGIAQWADAFGFCPLTTQNSVFYNNIPNNYEIEDGEPVVVSLGGNLSGDASMSDALTQTNDQNQTDPLFVDPGNLDYHLQAGSPCIDKGVATDAPATDLDGNPRDAKPDQGCYEFIVSGTHQPGAKAQSLTLMPNPAVADRAVLVIENDWSGKANVQIFSQNGTLVRDIAAAKPAGRWAQVLEVRDLPAGIYLVRAQLGEQVHEGQLVKK